MSLLKCHYSGRKAEGTETQSYKQNLSSADKFFIFFIFNIRFSFVTETGISPNKPKESMCTVLMPRPPFVFTLTIMVTFNLLLKSITESLFSSSGGTPEPGTIPDQRGCWRYVRNGKKGLQNLNDFGILSNKLCSEQVTIQVSPFGKGGLRGIL